MQRDDHVSVRRRWLRIDLSGPDGPRAVLHVIGHRVPRTTIVPLALATRLAAQGVPTVIRRAGGAGGRPPRAGTASC